MKRSPISNRRGVVLMLLIVALAVACMLAVELAQSIALRGRAQQTNERHAQAAAIAHAAVERAAARLYDDSAYTGETWNVSADDLGGKAAARVTIEVAAIDGSPTQRTVVARAALGESPEGAIKYTRQTRLIILAP
jgi:type II secretory pathway component PulK